MFGTDADYLDYLDYPDWLRWPEGFVCPRCERVGGGRRRLPVRVLRGPHVGHGGDDVRPPQDAADVWFEACWMFASGKDGMSR